MRILFVSPFYKPHYGGIERFVEQLSRRFSKKSNCEVQVLTTTGGYVQRAHETSAPHSHDGNVSIVRLTSYLRDPRTWGFPVSVGSFIPGVRRAISEFSPDVVHLTNGGWFTGNLQAALAAGDRAVGFSPFHHPFPRTPFHVPMIAANAALARRIDFIHAATEWEASSIVGAYRASRNKVRVIPLGVDEVVGRAAPRDRRDVILHVGRISNYKGSLRLARAFVVASRNLPPEVRLAYVGEDGGELSAVRTFLRDHGLSDRFEQHSRITDQELSAQYDRAIAMVLPSRAEAFGYVCFEALARGCPVVVPDLAAQRELLPRGARFFPASDDKALIAILESIVSDREGWAQLSKDGLALVKGSYSADIMARAFWALYEEVLG
jgi:glycosyltransferase involved in cell wall biosynthesis